MRNQHGCLSVNPSAIAKHSQPTKGPSVASETRVAFNLFKAVKNFLKKSRVWLQKLETGFSYLVPVNHFLKKSRVWLQNYLGGFSFWEPVNHSIWIFTGFQTDTDCLNDAEQVSEVHLNHHWLGLWQSKGVLLQKNSGRKSWRSPLHQTRKIGNHLAKWSKCQYDTV